MNNSLSVIIPTHNRSSQLRRMMQLLEPQLLEVNAELVVVADHCTDDTNLWISIFEAPYTFKWIDATGRGAGAARNEGAAVATGSVLLFLDDDLEPGEELLRTHLLAHDARSKVVIGNLPFVALRGWDQFQYNLRSWWADKFHQMSSPGYRFGMEDLLSGHFSIDNQLFKQTGGFDTTICCKEDYEFGYRLIRWGAKFSYQPAAIAYHKDGVTDFYRSLQRKRLEGEADVAIGNLHPLLRKNMHLQYLPPFPGTKQKLLMRLMQLFPGIADALAHFLGGLMPYLEQFKLRHRWQRLNYLLHKYWYIRGALRAGFDPAQEHPEATVRKLDIDLVSGLASLKELVDRERPQAVSIYYGNMHWFDIPHVEGLEPISSAHLLTMIEARAQTLLPLIALYKSQRETVAEEEKQKPRSEKFLVL